MLSVTAVDSALDYAVVDTGQAAYSDDAAVTSELTADAATSAASESSDASFWTHAEVDDEASAFFDDSYVHELYITFDNDDWYDVLYKSHANDADDPYFAADFECDGVVIENVGVRFKGSSSFDIPGVKKSLKIDFDEFDEDNDELTFLGLKKLNLNNNYNDPTMMREKLFYDYASNFVEGAGRAVFTNVYINGELWGLYTAVEQVDKTYVQTRFGNDEDGNLFKATASDDAVADEPQADFGCDLTYLGEDTDAYDDYYELKTNETAYDYTELVEFIDVLNNTPTEDLATSIEPLLDVDDALACLAVNNLFANLDSYNGAAHNYYLYDRDDTGQFTYVLWDANESFGTFSLFTEPGQDMTELDPFWLPVAEGPPGQAAVEERPLMENLWAVDEYSNDYLRDLAEMLRGGFDVTSATERINELADLIRDDVAADPNKQYTYAQFETNLNDAIVDGGRTIYGLTSFIGDRADYLSAELDAYATQSDLRLNELMSVNMATAQDEAGDYDPWVEIYNFGPGLVDLSGLYLTDDAGDLTKWAIPSSNLDDGEFLTLWLDGETSEGSNHANFSLSAAGGALQLTDGVAVIDSVTFEAMVDDESLARVLDGDGEWESTDRPTPGAENLASVVSVTPVVLYINEFMADNDAFLEDPDEAGAYEDWVELYNPGTEAIDLSGMYMTDDMSDPIQWQFPDGMTIDAGGYLVVWADKDTDQGDDHAGFKLSTDGETIALYNTDGATLIDSIEFGVQTTDVSYGRYPDGDDNWIFMATPTPGAANVNATAANVAPTAEAGGPYSGTEGDTITFSGAASADSDGTIVAYAWDLDNDGEYDDAAGVTAGFDAATAGTFTVGLQVTDDDGATSVDTATVTVTVAPLLLGPVEDMTLTGLDLSGGDLEYLIEPARDGYLTLLTDDGDVQWQLIDPDTMSEITPTEAVSEGLADYLVDGAETYLLRLSGEAGSFDLRLVNLVDASNATVDVYGTDGEDSFGVDCTSCRVSINDVGYDFDESVFTSVRFDGAGGVDQAEITGTVDAERIDLSPLSGSLSEGLVDVAVVNTESIVVDGGGGVDSAYLRDSDGDDTVVADGQGMTMSGETLAGEAYSNSVSNATYAHAYATSGGFDQAELIGTAGGYDCFKGYVDPSDANGQFGKMWTSGTQLRAKFFDEIIAWGDEGDKAVFVSTTGGDRLEAGPDAADLSNSCVRYVANGFSDVRAYAASGGDDTLVLTESEGDDEMWLRSHKTVAVGADYRVLARSFDHVVADASVYSGDTDEVRLFDSAEDDALTITLDEARLIGGVDFTATGFRRVKAYSSYDDDVDIATITGSDDDDALYAYSDCNAVLDFADGVDLLASTSEGAALLRAVAFSEITVESGDGDDTANTSVDLAALDYLLRMEGQWDE